VLGEPFQIQANGVLWIAGVAGDGKVRPYPAEEWRPLGASLPG
jgi:hypothetical protein